MAPEHRLTLLNGFGLYFNQRPVRIALIPQRVVAFLALHDRDLVRAYVANTLWPDTTEQRAAAILRTVLWRLRSVNLHVIESNARLLWLAPTVSVDVRELEWVARQVLDRSFRGPLEHMILTEAGELLPGFYDDWVISERERLWQVRMHALEALCERLTAAGQHAQAVAAGLAAVAMEPLRESAHALLIKAHLAAGNRPQAIRQFERYREILRAELGLEPHPDLCTITRVGPARSPTI